MKPPLDELHGGAAGTAGERFAALTLEGFDALGVRAVVIGGTALRLLGSPIPSIDLDCLIHEKDWDRHEVYDFIAARQFEHRAAYADSYLEVDAMEWPNRVWNSRAFYVPIELFRRAGTRFVNGTLAGNVVEAELPAPDALLLMKLKALCNRAAKLRATVDPVYRAAIVADALAVLGSAGSPFFRRKAGKDLADVTTLLQREGNLPRAGRLAEDLGIRQAMAAGWAPVEDDLVEEAARLLARHGLPGHPRRVLDAIIEELGPGS